MGRRFSDLDSVYNRLLATNYDFNQLPATDELRKYKEWKQDPEKRKLPEGSVPNKGRMVKVGVEAFGLPTTGNTNKVKVKISNRAKTQYDSLPSAIKTEIVLSTNLNDYSTIGGFRPARVIIAARKAATSQTSKITGNRYKDSTGASYTIPFGRKTATQTEFEAQDAIIAAADATHVVTFTPESYYRG